LEILNEPHKRKPVVVPRLPALGADKRCAVGSDIDLLIKGLLVSVPHPQGRDLVEGGGVDQRRQHEGGSVQRFRLIQAGCPRIGKKKFLQPEIVPAHL
jgi:hypothetical protein